MPWINREEIAKHREVSKNVKEDKINPHIEDAQFLDVRPLLGNDLYNLIDGDLQSIPNIELLEGGQYTIDKGTFFNPGLNKVLSIFSYARYMLHGSFTDTGFGLVEKSSQDSQAVSAASKRDLYTRDRETAMQYWFEVKKFLDRNTDSFPSWKKSCKPSRLSGLRISKITK